MCTIYTILNRRNYLRYIILVMQRYRIVINLKIYYNYLLIAQLNVQHEHSFNAQLN